MSHNTDDKGIGTGYDSTLFKRLMFYVKPYNKYVFLAILLNILLSVTNPLRPYLSKIAIDSHIAKADYHGLALIISLIVGSLVLQSIFQYFLSYYTQYIGQRIIYDIRIEIFSHIQKLALKFFDKTPIGRLVTRTTNDVESLNELFSSGIVNVFSDVFIVIWIFGFMFYMDWRLSLIALSVLPIIIFASFLFKKMARQSYLDVRLHLAKLNTYMQERISGISIVQLFHKQTQSIKQFSRINKDHTDANIKGIFYYSVFFPFVEFLSALVIALILWYASGEILQSKLTIGVLFAFIQYVEMFFRPMRDLSEKYNILQTAMAASERIFVLLDDKTFINNPEEPIKLNELNGRIEFKDVSFAYNDKDFVLKNINLSINPGETIAIVGHTGAGKTSIINILSRFYDIQNGSIYVDGTDIKNIDIPSLRKNISIVLQDVFLFPGSIKYNISHNDSSISDEKIKDAAKLVGADEFINNLPNGYNEIIKERGASLSVGQKQLISFARALAFNPKILILDEATSSVDTETEILIQKAINTLLKNRTSIVIAHRLSTIQKADKIVVLHKGEIKETGTHNELLLKKGLYYRLYQLQYKEQEINI